MRIQRRIVLELLAQSLERRARYSVEFADRASSSWASTVWKREVGYPATSWPPRRDKPDQSSPGARREPSAYSIWTVDLGGPQSAHLEVHVVWTIGARQPVPSRPRAGGSDARQRLHYLPR